MPPLLELLTELDDFMRAGGKVLWAMLLLSMMLWFMIFERYLYLRFGHRRYVARVLNAWSTREDKTSWRAHKIRQMMVAEVSIRLNRSLALIGTLICVCPLLGLLGTVNGMIHVFEAMAILGTGNPRSMAAGISLATIPTMAGMVIAISGLFFNAHLHQRAGVESRRAADVVLDEGQVTE